MALYIPASRRRRNAILLAVASAVVALVLGYLLGRQATPSVSAQVASVRSDAPGAGHPARGPPHRVRPGARRYGQDTVQGGTLDALDGIQHDAIRTMDRAPWVEAAARAKVLDAIAATSQAARDRADSATFLAAVTAAAEQVRTTVGERARPARQRAQLAGSWTSLTRRAAREPACPADRRPRPVTRPNRPRRPARPAGGGAPARGGRPGWPSVIVAEMAVPSGGRAGCGAVVRRLVCHIATAPP